jgi:hypothetical protein
MGNTLVPISCQLFDTGLLALPDTQYLHTCPTFRSAVFKRGVGVSVLAEYLKEANKQVEVWLQVSNSSVFGAFHARYACLRDISLSDHDQCHRLPLV